MKSFHTNKFISLILFNLLFFQNQFFSNKLVAQENKNIPTSEYIRSFPKENYYILGPGDGLNIVVSESCKTSVWQPALSTVRRPNVKISNFFHT